MQRVVDEEFGCIYLGDEGKPDEDGAYGKACFPGGAYNGFGDFNRDMGLGGGIGLDE